jgi:cytochrome c-type biogenesis protein CcmH/NrfG
MSTSVIASSTRNGFVLGLSAGLVLASAFFLIRGGPAAPWLAAATASPDASRSAKASTPAAGDSAGSMEAATLALATRLAARGGPDEQWDLLAQSYDFLGRNEEAARARQHRTTAERNLGDAVAASAMLLPVTPTTAVVVPAAAPANARAASLLASAEQHRRKREFKEACAAYAAVVALGAMTADAWADYADAQASLAGHLAGEPQAAIDRALAIDPRQAKALWLKASLEHEQHRYKEALATWRRLLALVPPGSSDARIVEANIAEATRLATS